MGDSGDEGGEVPRESRDNSPDEIPKEEDFNPNDDTPDEVPEEELFDPNDDTPDEVPEEELFDPNDDTPNEVPEEELFDPNDDTPDEVPEEDLFDPNDDTPDEVPEEELFDPSDDTPDEVPEEELFNPNNNSSENYNPCNSGQIVVVVPDISKENSDQENEIEPESEEDPENEIEFITPEGESAPPVESDEIRDLMFTAEELESEYFPEESSELEEQIAEEIESELEDKSEETAESEEEEHQPDSQPEDLELINPEGEPVSNPHIVPPELIPLKDALEKLYEEQQNEEKIENEPKEISEQESEIISKQESDSKEKSEIKSEQKPELVPEKDAKPLNLKGEEIKPITDKEELDKGKQYDIKYIVKKHEKYFRENQFKKPKKIKEKTQEKKESKPLKLKGEDVKPITGKKELDDYKPYEYRRIVGTRFDTRLREEQEKKSEKKRIKKDTQHKPKRPKMRGDDFELIPEPEYEKKNVRKIDREADIRRLKKIEEKSKNDREQVPTTKPRVIEKLDEIIEPDEPEKSEEKKESKQEELPQVQIVNEKEIKQKKSIEQPTKQTKSEIISKNRLELRGKYRQETGKRPLYNKKETKGFLTWLERQKKREEWQILLEKWIWEANEAKISKEFKKELIEIIRNYKTSRELYFKLVKLLENDTLSKEETDELEILVNKLESIPQIQTELFKNINTFQWLYKNYHIGYKLKLISERNKFINFLANKLHRFKELFEKENLYSTLDLINDLRKELQKFPEFLIKVFPKRVRRYTDTMLSILWRGETTRNEYIKNIKRNFRSKKIKFSMKSLELLEKILVKNYDKNRDYFTNLIKSYKEGKINTLDFIYQLKLELGKISNRIPIIYEELSLFFGMSSTYIKNKLIILTNLNAPNYNTNYLFSHENLNDFLSNIQVLLGEKSKKLKAYIEKYIYLNPSIKLYSLQQYIIENPDYFSLTELNLLEPVRFYWLGFLYADGHLEEKMHKIQFKLSKLDEERVKKYAKDIGYPIEKIQEILEIKEYKGEKKIFNALRLWFGCKPMAKDLKELGFIGFKLGIEGIPEIVKSLILRAKQISRKNKTFWYETAEGRCALAFLLGFYDGDGTYNGGMSARIYNTNKKFLEEVRTYYGIENIIREVRKSKKSNKQIYYLSLGPNLFRAMLESYKLSMIRKRNPNI